MSRTAAIFLLGSALLFASNFSEAVRLYKDGRLAEAKEYFEQAYHKDGVDAAGYFLGIYYIEGLGGEEQDLQKAEHYLIRAAQSGNVRARCALAKIYRLRKRPELADETLGDIDPGSCERLNVARTAAEHTTKNDVKKD